MAKGQPDERPKRIRKAKGVRAEPSRVEPTAEAQKDDTARPALLSDERRYADGADGRSGHVPLVSPAVVEFHPYCKCRWCGGRFLKAYGVHWACESPECFARQRLHARARKDVQDGDNPWFYLPTPAQVELDESLIPNLLFGGAAGVSKSRGLRELAYRRCMDIPNYHVLLLRRTYPELDKTHLRAMAVEEAEVGAKYQAQQRTLKWPSGSLIEAGHCDSKQDMYKYLSTEYDAILFDEGSTFERAVILEICSRARTSKPQVIAAGGALVRIGSNPGGVGALFLKDFYIDKKPDADEFPLYNRSDYGYIAGTLRDNPYLDPSYKARLEQLPKDRQKQLLDGDWSVFAGQFFGMFNPEVHVVAA